MIEREYNGNVLEMWDDPYDLPHPRFHKFQKFIMINSGIGETVADVHRHIGSIRQMNAKGDQESVDRQLTIMSNALIYAMENISPLSMAFAVMVKSKNGVECKDFTDSGLNKLIKELASTGISYSMIKNTVEFLKKKWMNKSLRHSHR